jgi:hypothetical protein
MGGYGYEIIGGVLIVLSSLVGEQMRPEWKVRSYAAFILIALCYSGFGIHERREASNRERIARQESKEELESVKKDMSSLLAGFAQMRPSIASINSDLASVQKNLESAKRAGDPRAIAEIEEKVEKARRNAEWASKRYLVAMVPGTVRELRSWHGSWDRPEGEGLISEANSLRSGLLEGMELTTDDRAASNFFGDRDATGARKWDTEKAARYLEALTYRIGIPQPVTALTATTQ